jgi:hypothetical protein
MARHVAARDRVSGQRGSRRSTRQLDAEHSLPVSVGRFVDLVCDSPEVRRIVDSIYTFQADGTVHVWTVLGRLDWHLEQELAGLERQALTSDVGGLEQVEFFALPTESAEAAEELRSAIRLFPKP